MSKAKAVDPNKPFSAMSIDKVCMKVSLNISDPLRKSMPDKGEAQAIANANGMKENAVRVSVALFDKTTVDCYRKPLGELREEVKKRTLPVASDAQPFRLVGMQAQAALQSKVNELKKKVEQGVHEFLEKYDTPSFWAEQQARLGNKFNRDEFLDKKKLKEGFDEMVDYNQDPFAGEDWKKSASVYLTPEHVASIEKSLEAQNKQIRQYANQNLWEQLMGSIQKLADTCAKDHGSGKGSIFRNTFLPNVKELVDLIPTLNFEGDQKLEKVRTEMQDMLRDVDNEDLRKDPEKRKKVATKSSKLVKELESIQSYQ